MAKRIDSELIEPPNVLASKVKKKVGRDPAAMLERAEKEIAKLGDTYTEWVTDDIDKLVGALDAARTDTDNQGSHLQELFRVAHDMKGQGGSFGYALVTEIGDSLCKFVQSLEAAGEREFPVVEAHVDALKAIIHHRVRGDGGEVGQEIVAGLRQAVSKVRS